MVDIEFKLTMRYRDALTTVLEEADIHSDEAEELEALRDILDYRIERLADYATDVEIY